MCGNEGGLRGAAGLTGQRLAGNAGQATSEIPEPESTLSRLLLSELGVFIHPQALRIFIRSNWPMVKSTAHAIHGSKGATP